MKDLTIGLHIAAATAPEAIEQIAAADRAGVEVAWLTVGGAAPDPFAVFSAAASRAEAIEFGTSIVPTYPRHPISMAQGALVVDQLAPGRLRLGIGPSHKPAVEGIWGIPFEKPLSHLREYLIILKALLGEGRVDFDGELLSAHAAIPGPTRVRVMTSALRERAFRLAGEMTEGAISWMCPPPYIRDVARPALEAGARDAGRTPPKMIVHVPVIACDDWERVRAGARARFGFYQTLPYYSQMLQDAGYAEAAEAELTDNMIRGLVVWGSEQQVADRLAALPDYGADEIVASLVELTEDPAAAHERTVSLLGQLARS